MSDRMNKAIAAAALLLLFGAAPLAAQSSLFYFEFQGLAAYSTRAREIQLYSLMSDDVMQKPSLGFDFVRRLSTSTRDWGVLAVQFRLAYNQEGDHRFEPQLYNAYLRFKAGFADIWAGHSRPALGLDYALDSHALLLPSPAMSGYGFDRDWGVGLHRDYSWGDAAATLTTGSGMPLYFKGNYLAAVRVSRGVLARDNFSVGLSLAGGRILDTMGNHLLSPDPLAFSAVAADAACLWRNVENRFEALAGRKDGADIMAFFWRAGLNLLAEGRLKVEAQPLVMKTGGDWNWRLAGGLTYQITADLAARSMVQYDRDGTETRFVFQVYYYKRL